MLLGKVFQTKSHAARVAFRQWPVTGLPKIALFVKTPGFLIDCFGGGWFHWNLALLAEAWLVFREQAYASLAAH